MPFYEYLFTKNDLPFAVKVQESTSLGADHRGRADPDVVELLQFQRTRRAILSVRSVRGRGVSKEVAS